MRFLILALLLLPSVAAMSGHMTLLAVADDPAVGGNTADVYLEVRPGNGAIFIDSFPLTKLDTQSSTRYANQIACDFLQEDCARYDFFYTIRADSTIVGGPSAGAAIAVLTAAVLDGKETRQDVALTGTINSGGIIGPVGGVTEKIEGARRAGIAVVLVPAFMGNTTLNATDGIEVVRVGTLAEALAIFTGTAYAQDLPAIEEPEGYGARMTGIADEICRRNALLKARVAERGLAYEDPNNYTRRMAVLPEDRAYSLASLCFSSNIELGAILYRNATPAARAAAFASIADGIADLEANLSNRSLDTISDLEVYAIVKERLTEAKAVLNGSDGGALAYAEERLLSARSWYAFFGMPGKRILLDDTHLRQACLSKVAEAEERIGYVRIYSPALIAPAEETLRRARGGADMVLCIAEASKAKAQANLVAGALFLEEQDLQELVAEKVRADELVVRQQIARGSFPLLGYSYTRYAADLADAQPYSALLFSEYALEMSNLDMYFPHEEQWRPSQYAVEGVALFGFGTLFGVGVALFLLQGRVVAKGKKRKKS